MLARHIEGLNFSVVKRFVGVLDAVHGKTMRDSIPVPQKIMFRLVHNLAAFQFACFGTTIVAHIISELIDLLSVKPPAIMMWLNR